MYLKGLSKLRDFDISEELIERLDVYLEQAARREIWRFSPGFAAKEIGADLRIVQELLLRAAQIKAIQVYFEIECPEGDSDFYVAKLGEIDWNTERQCRVCDTIYTPSPDHIWLVFGERAFPAPKAMSRLL